MTTEFRAGSHQPPAKESIATSLPPLPEQASLVSVQDVKQALAQLCLLSTALEGKLHQAVTASRTTISTSQERISSLAPQVELIRDEAKILSTRLSTTADTARRVSKRIRSLDEEKKRLTLATQWALHTSELKVSGGSHPETVGSTHSAHLLSGSNL